MRFFQHGDCAVFPNQAVLDVSGNGLQSDCTAIRSGVFRQNAVFHRKLAIPRKDSTALKSIVVENKVAAHFGNVAKIKEAVAAVKVVSDVVLEFAVIKFRFAIVKSNRAATRGLVVEARTVIRESAINGRELDITLCSEINRTAGIERRIALKAASVKRKV